MVKGEVVEADTEFKRRKESAYRAFLALLGVLIAVSFNIAFTLHRERVADQRWCGLMISFDERYQQLKNPDPEAVKLAQDIHALRSSLDCAADS